ALGETRCAQRTLQRIGDALRKHGERARVHDRDRVVHGIADLAERIARLVDGEVGWGGDGVGLDLVVLVPEGGAVELGELNVVWPAVDAAGAFPGAVADAHQQEVFSLREVPGKLDEDLRRGGRPGQRVVGKRARARVAVERHRRGGDGRVAV